MSGLPEPLTPPDCDLRGYDFMPLFGHRLFNSDFDVTASDAEFRAALRLWWSAWQQCPAASLPDDERALCRFAGLGNDLRKWRKIAAKSLQGFCRCADGRLYHKVLAKEAKSAYARRINDRERKRKYRESKETTPLGPVGHDADATRDTTGTERGQDAGHDADVLPDRTGQGQDSIYIVRSSPGREDDQVSAPEPGEAVAGLTTQPKPKQEPEGFAAFYEAYPRKDARRDAAKAFPTAVKEAGGLDALMAGLRAFRFSPERQYQPLPASWLRGKRWEDAQDAVTSTAAMTGKPEARDVDARYFSTRAADVETIKALPQPPRGTPEYRAWENAHMGFPTPLPGTEKRSVGRMAI